MDSLRQSEGNFYIVCSTEWIHEFPCFLWKCDSRDRKQHYIKKQRQIRKTLDPEVKNIEKESLVAKIKKKLLLSLLYIQLGPCERIYKSSAERRKMFQILCDCFPHLPKAGLKKGYLYETDER